jgi:transposase
MAERKPAKRATKTTPARRTAIGRPSKLTPELSDRIVEMLRIGCYIEEAAASAGISKQVVYDWQRNGARTRNLIESGEAGDADLSDHDLQCVSFLDSVDQAHEEWFVESNRALHKFSTDEDGRLTKDGAAVLMWRMERKNPGRYGRRAPVEVNLGGQVDNPIRHEVAVSADALLAKLQAVGEDA